MAVISQSGEQQHYLTFPGMIFQIAMAAHSQHHGRFDKGITGCIHPLITNDTA